jgi:type I restriction enzyme, S subunit
MSVAPWPGVRSRFVFQRRDVRGADAPLASATKEGVFLREDLDISVWNPESDVSNYKLVEPGDFVIGLRSFQHGISHSEVRGIVSPAYTVLRGTAIADPNFFRYYFRSVIFISQLANLTQGIRQGQTIDIEAFANLELLVPPLDEQRRLADFLDTETARIDRLVKAISESSNLLEARRQALLMSAFPDQSCPTARLGYYLDLVTSGPRGWGDYVGYEGTPFFRSANLRRDEIEPNLEDLALVDPPPSTAAEAARSSVRASDVLVGITGANTGWVSFADQRIAQANVSQHVCLVRPGKKIDGRWLAYALSAPQVQELLLGSQYGGTKTQLSLGDIRDLIVPLPPLSEQQRIVTAINQGAAAITAERALRDRQLGLLAERRQALITAAVTRHVDVTTAGGNAV